MPDDEVRPREELGINPRFLHIGFDSVDQIAAVDGE